ncbi:hypothetical protein EAMG_05463 [Escherichia coli M056]|uniref:DUF2635 domain-containing protein n=1 Tax=Escherichia coli TaxID=562 RepID=UPI000A185C78|nr:DUF2635 domain-containing protein [Escherichia coli]OSK12865.1 hypothetical protein EAMG_05467 [Escherichia coli M056]OSK12869.1 hypothetical protein EAMG_05463 [Escherichia coli M056]
MFVKPVKGRSVPDPFRGDILPEDGRNVAENAYWYRREVAGDIEKNAREGVKNDRKL